MKNWLSNSEFVSKLKINLEKSGIPLELKTINKVNNCGFEAWSHYYEDINESGEVIYRELDVLASDIKSFTFEYSNCTVILMNQLFIECKHLTDTDFIVFQSEDKNLYSFPLGFSGSYLISRDEYFKFPLIIKKVAEVDLTKIDKSDNFKDRTTNDACNQLMSAIYSEYKENDLKLDFKKTVDKLKYEYRIKNVPDFQEKISIKKVLENQNVLMLVNYYPILVINDNMEIIKAEYDVENGKIINFENVGFGIYPFTSMKEYNKPFLRSINVIITNYNYLEQILHMVNEYSKKLLMNIKNDFYSENGEQKNNFLREIY